MKKLFILPDFNDEDKQRTGRYLNVIILSAIGQKIQRASANDLVGRN